MEQSNKNLCVATTATPTNQPKTTAKKKESKLESFLSVLIFIIALVGTVIITNQFDIWRGFKYVIAIGIFFVSYMLLFWLCYPFWKDK